MSGHVLNGINRFVWSLAVISIPSCSRCHHHRLHQSTNVGRASRAKNLYCGCWVIEWVLSDIPHWMIPPDISSAQTISLGVNIKKSNCMRIGSRHDKMCTKITMCDGGELPWVDEIRYLGVVIISALQNSSVLSTKLSGPSIKQQMVSSPKSVEWLLRKLWFNFWSKNVCLFCRMLYRCMQLGQKFNAITGLYI